MPFLSFENIAIKGIATALPKNVLEIESLIPVFGKETVETFRKKTGITSLHIALELQTASDLGFEAAKVLLNTKGVDEKKLGFIVFVSKTPDYRSPATAAVLHNRLGLSQDCIAFDVNIGGTGFIYGLQIGCSLLGNLNSDYGLLVVGDTTSKQFSPSDPNLMMFGDGASAILLEKIPNSKPIYLKTVSHSEKFKSFIIPGGGFRVFNKDSASGFTNDTPVHDQEELIIDVAEFYSYETSEMPAMISEFMLRSGSALNDFDFFALSGVTKTGLNQISGKNIFNDNSIKPDLKTYGDTFGNSIPLSLTQAFGHENNRVSHVLASAYGEGISFGVADFFVDTCNVLPVILTDLSYGEGEVSHDFS